MALSQGQVRILQDLLGSSPTSIRNCGFHVSPIYCGSRKDLQAMRSLEVSRLAYLFMTGETHACPQYWAVAAKDYHEAKKTMREMYVNEACDDIKFA